jgi:GxxExxY protein
MTELLLKDEVYAVVGAAMEVYNVLGPEFLEAVYQEALEIELRDRNVPFEHEKDLHIIYKGRTLKKTYTADIVSHNLLIAELKTLDRLTGKEESQLLNYLKATGLRVGVLLNFGHPTKLEWKRMIL